MAEYTRAVVGEAGAMLDEALAAAGAALGMNSLPDQAELNTMIQDATATYALHGPHNETQVRGRMGEGGCAGCPASVLPVAAARRGAAG